MQDSSSSVIQAFLRWFKSKNGSVHQSLGITTFPGQGRGAVALTDIPEGTTLFTIPRDLTLSTRTLRLPALLGAETWKKYKLGEAWTGLILCLMWEEAKGGEGEWHEYLASLPTTFDTPMFWSEEDLQELKGCAVAEKLGKEDAERDYHTKVLPVIQSREDLFPPALIDTYYSLSSYHMQGSRILSRGFTLEKWTEEGTEEIGYNANERAVNTSADNAKDLVTMMIDEEDDDDADDEDLGDASDVAMVPLADLLNARYGCENVKLFYDADYLRMVTIKPIEAGEQIYNTYGNPPNSDLLRRYGHVDLLLLDEDGREGNMADEVEVRADLVVRVACACGFWGVAKDAVSEAKMGKEMEERIEWWLEEGEDDVFTLTFKAAQALPPELLSFIHLLLIPPAAWKKRRRLTVGQVPQKEVLKVALKLLRARMKEYGTTVEEDEAMLAEARRPDGKGMSTNKRHAIIVRLGEKRILVSAMERLVSNSCDALD